MNWKINVYPSVVVLSFIRQSNRFKKNLIIKFSKHFKIKIQSLRIHPWLDLSFPVYRPITFSVFPNKLMFISVKDTPVAFTAGMTTYSTTWRGDILVFPHVITNKGHGYSSSSGKFTAPRDGTYVFYLTVVSYGSNYLRLDIVHDGDSKVRTWSDSSASHQTGTNLVVLELDRGDAVWVKRDGGRGYCSHSVPITTFSGFILWVGSLNAELLCDLCN